MNTNPLYTAIVDSMIAAPSGDITGVVSSSFCFFGTFPGFDGHFPGNPILPAVIQLQTGAVATGLAGYRIVSMSRAKFTRLVKPGDQIDATCELSEPADEMTAAVRLAVGDETAASFRLVLKKGDHDG